jgi:hypothetical protein
MAETHTGRVTVKFNCLENGGDQGWSLTFDTICGPDPGQTGYFVKKVVFCGEHLDQLLHTSGSPQSPTYHPSPDTFIQRYTRYVRELYRQREPWDGVSSGDCICVELDDGSWHCLCGPPHD